MADERSESELRDDILRLVREYAKQRHGRFAISGG